MSHRNHRYYRKLYKTHYGEIPKDEDGRSYDIHHIDGDHTNNDPSNLSAVPIYEHYRIHKAKKEWGSCWAISLRMKLSSEEISAISKKSNEERVKRGTHNFQGEENSLRMKEIQNERVKKGTHVFIGANKGANHPQYDHTLRVWKNKLSGQVVMMTNHELIKTFNLKSGAVSRVINDKGLRSTGGWELLSHQSTK